MKDLGEHMDVDKPLLLDGGLASQLERQGFDLNHPMWSARLLADNPEAIIEAHLAFLKAGAQFLITASYQASLPGFLRMGFSRKDGVSLMQKSVSLAIEARNRFQKQNPQASPIWIAASMGPYAAYLSDGSEYTGVYTASQEEIRDFHREKLEILGETEADCLAVETIPALREAEVLAELLKESPKKAWISFTCKDGKHIQDGNLLKTCMALFTSHPQVFALGINCTAPEYILALVQEIKGEIGNKKLIIYPNSGEKYDPTHKNWSDSDQEACWEEQVKTWLAEGVDIIGGCCRTGPEHIREIARNISHDF